MADRFDLHFATLAFESGLVDREGFVELLSSWEQHPETPLRDLLEARGWVVGEDRERLERRAREATARERPPGTTHPAADGPQGETPAGTQTASGSKPAPRPEPGPRPAGLPPTDVGTVLPGVDDGDEGKTVTWWGDGQDPTSGAGAGATNRRPARPAVPYLNLELHATGGIGQVWRATDPHLGRTVALKVLRPDRPHGGKAADLFLSEAKITATLEHPGIVPVYEMAERLTDRPAYYTMRFVEGHTLRDAGRAYHEARAEGKAGDFERAVLLDAFVAACQAVAFANDRGVLHRDLKGQNVVLGAYGEVVVLDWGLAKSLAPAEPGSDFQDPAGEDDDGLDEAQGHNPTLPGQVLGTPAYMAPEQARGEIDRLDTRSDVYGLGATLYELLAGRAPFRGKTPEDVIRKVIHQEPARPRDLAPDTPPALEAVCRKAMSKDPARRYANPSELATEVRRFVAGEPVRAYPEPWPKRLGRWARRHQTAVAATAALLLTAAAALGINRQMVAAERDLVRRALGEAEENLRVAYETVGQMLLRVADNRLGQTPGSEAVRTALADDAVGRMTLLQEFRRGNPGLLRAAAEVSRNAANLYRMTNRFPRAETLYQKAVRDQTTLADAGEPEDRHRLAAILWDRAELLSVLGRPREAGAQARQALAIVRGLGKESPRAPRVARWEGYVRVTLAELALEAGRNDEAAREAAAAVNLLTPLADSPAPGVFDVLMNVQALRRRGEALAALGDPAGAESALAEAVRRARRAAAVGDERDRRFHLAFASTALGAFRRDVPTLDEAVTLLSRLAADDPGVPLYRYERALALEARGVQKPHADDLRKALDVLDSLVTSFPEVPRYQAARGRVLGHLGRLALAGPSPTNARETLAAAVAASELARKANPDDAECARTLERDRADLARARATSAAP